MNHLNLNLLPEEQGGAILTMSKEKHHKYHRTSNALANLFAPELSPICAYIYYDDNPPKKNASKHLLRKQIHPLF